MKRKQRPESFPCPHCGANVPINAKFCRECGSDHETGWADDPDYFRGDGDAVGKNDDFDYDEFVEENFPNSPRRRKNQFWKAVACVILVIVIGSVLRLW